MSSPEQVLTADMLRELQHVRADGWYPIALLLDLMERLDEKLGPYALRQMGRTLFKMSHAERLKDVAHSARDVVYGIDGMYHHANRGQDIGGWRVVVFQPGRAELEKTTPHHCMMEEGILAEALATVGVGVNIRQSECFRKGAEACRYLVSSYIIDERWNGPSGPPEAPGRVPSS